MNDNHARRMVAGHARPHLVWARLRVLEAGTAEVFDSDGNTLAYDSEDTARAALMDAEFVALDGLDEDDAAERGFALDELAPPQAEDDALLREPDGAEARRRGTDRHMYLPRAFAETDLAALDALLARDSFVTLVTVRDGAPSVSHLPVLYRRDGEQIELIGHWARPNPQARHAGPALVIVHGPHAYVSPAWYPDKEEAARVPTWNYAVAHLDGTARDASTTRPRSPTWSMRLSRQHEATRRQRLALRTRTRRPPQCSCAASSVSASRSNAHRTEVQAQPEPSRPPTACAVAAQLEQQPREASREIAALMRARTPSTED